MRHTIISPDGFPISQDTYRSRKKAVEAFWQWQERYKAQGYYSAIRNGKRMRIDWRLLADYCKII